MKTKNAAQQALTNAVNRAIANGAPVYENIPVTPVKTLLVTRTTVETLTIRGMSEQGIRAQSKLGILDFDTKEQTLKFAEKLTTPEYRIVVVEDTYGYEHGDYETQEEEDQVNNIIQCHGVWGYHVESRNTVDGDWEHIDSYSGFLGNYQGNLNMMEQACASVPAGVKVDVVDEHGDVVDDAWGTRHYAAETE